MIRDMHCHPAMEVRYFDRLDRPMNSPKKISEIKYGRKLDAVSKAQITYDLSGPDCCGQLGALESIAHKVAIYENGDMVWFGWLEDIEYHNGQVIVPAFDAFGWMDRRIIHEDIEFTATDLTDIFEAVWEDAVAPDPIAAELILFPSSVLESRKVKASDLTYAGAVIREMLDTGLDITVVGQKVIAGVIPTTKPMEFALRDFEDKDNFALTKKGSVFANRIIVDATAAVQGIYPPGPPLPTTNYPLVEHIVRDSNIQDQTSADNAAKSRYEYFGRRVPRLIQTGDALVLQPHVNVKINDLIPGIRVILDTEGLCYSVKQEYRLGSVDVTASQGQRKIAVTMQPSSVDSLADAEDPLT